MLTYITRRILLMIPTLFGITVMVFFIARCAPGRPGTGAFGEGGQMDAEGQRKQREWYEQRLGLNLPYHLQYLRWWKGMFTRKTEAKAWTEDFRPIWTLTRPTDELYTLDRQAGKWYLISGLTSRVEILSQDDAALLHLLASEDRKRLDDEMPILDGFPVPQHLLATGALRGIEQLDPDLLIPAVEARPIEVNAIAWTGTGQPVYLHPNDRSRYIYARGSVWFEIKPSRKPARWTVFSQDDPSFRAKIPGRVYRRLPEIKDGRPLPRHVTVPGQSKKLDQEFDAQTLTRLTLPTGASIDAWLWTEDGWPIFTAEDMPAIKLYQAADGNWRRLMGESRLVEPSFVRYRQDDQRFLEQIDESDRLELLARARTLASQGLSVPHHLVMSGISEPIEEPPPRQRRKYSHAILVPELTLGFSLTTRTTVMKQIKTRLPVTLGINLLAFPIIYVLALPTGMLMALKRGQRFDRGCNVVMLALWSVPYVLTATLFIGYLAQGGKGLEIFPTGGLKSVNYDELDFIHRMLDRAFHLVLPVTCFVYGGFAYLAKQMRASMLENFTMDYVRTARAKGVSKRDIVIKHVLRNSLLPLITIFATILPAMIAGAVILETMFSIEGMGLFAFRGLQNRDYDVVQAVALIAGSLTLVSLLLADICYAFADPRITYK